MSLTNKVPPQEIEVEKAILATILQLPTAYEIAGDILNDQCFYKAEHHFIFKAIRTLANSGKPIDLLTVVDHLKSSGELEKAGDMFYLMQLLNLPPITDLTYHCKILHNAYQLRQLIETSFVNWNRAYEPGANATELIDKMTNALSGLNKGGEQIETMQDNCQSFVQVLDEKRAKAAQGLPMGITSGYPEIDELTYGWQPEDLITLAALSSMGKTAYALNLSRNAAMAGTPVAFFSREMSKQKLMERLVSMESQILLSQIRSGKIDDSEYDTLIKKGIKKLENAPIYLIPASGYTWLDVRRKARQLVNKSGVGLLIDDYIQLGRDVDTKGKTREQILATISAENKITAQQTRTAFFQLSQVDKKLEKEKREPVISDLRESSAIGNDSDMVAFLYRPEYFGDMVDDKGASTKGVTYLKFAKFRDGEKDVKVRLRADLSIQKFFSADQDGGWKPFAAADGLFEKEENKFLIK